MTAQSIYKSPAGEQAVMALYESLLRRWPVPYTTLNCPTRHGDTFAIACGQESSPPLVLLHGAGTNSAMWAGDVYAYSQHNRVFAVDLLGEPGRSASNRPAWDGPAYAEWLEDVLDALKIETVSLIGLSQGGWTALKFAVYRPARVKSLVLLTPGGITPDKPSFVIRAIPLSFLGRWGLRRINRLVLGDQPIAAEVEDATTLIMTNFKARIGALPIFSDTELQRLILHLTTTIIPRAGHAVLNTTTYILPFITAAART